MRRLSVAVCAVALSVFASMASAQGFEDEPSAGAVAFDLVIVRPLSLVTTVLGAGLFVVSVPFAAIQGDPLAAADTLVVDPARYTFTRPLGDSD